MYDEAKRRQQILQQAAANRVVIRHQHGDAPPGIAQHPALDRGGLARMHRLRQAELHAKAAARARYAGDGQVAAHDGRKQAADRKPEADTGDDGRAFRLHPLERFEDTLQVGLGNADPGILDLEHRGFVADVQTEPHLPGLGELYRVGQQIDQDLPQPPLVGVDDLRHA